MNSKLLFELADVFRNEAFESEDDSTYLEDTAAEIAARALLTEIEELQKVA